MSSEEKIKKLLELVADTGSALESVGVQLRRGVAEIVGEKAPAAGKEWNANKIKWEQAEGNKGPFERSEDFNNPKHKMMVKDLAAHGGRLTHEGFFFWLFQNGATVGRKSRGKKAPEPKAEVDITAAIKSKFPEDLASLLMFDVEGDFIVMKPREYLGGENFARIASVVRGEGGEYISAGKESHFRVPRK